MVTINRFSVGEIYHCYNRGVDKRITFNIDADYKRFVELLFLCNDKNPKQRSNLGNISHDEIFNTQKNNPLVSIGAYTLMPNHFHLLLEEIVDGGISTFMGILGNSYTKYFNIKNNRNGNLFIKPFLSKHIENDQHFSHIAQYIHLNTAELFEPKWKEGVLSNSIELEKKLIKYPYSSLLDYHVNNRVENNLLNQNFKALLSEDLPPLNKIILEAIDYYREIK